ncbi:vWA-like protein, partial [Serendipita vermifera]
SSPQTLRITMPTSIAPRYGSPPTNIPWWKPNNHNRFDLKVAIQMNKDITSVSSPSHPIGLTLGCAEREPKGDFEPSKAFVYLGDSVFLEKDIVIVISAQGLDIPRCSVERWLASEGAEETTDAYALTLVPKFDLPPLPSQEYIFLVDRSGSMGGGRMDSVKASLQIMLRSLPSRDTTFNIVSFGSRYSSLWPSSQMYSAESVKEASKHVDAFAADYGGTQLRSAIQFAFDSRVSAKSAFHDTTPTAVFVLTDGETWDLDATLNEISTTVKAAKEKNSLLRTFVLGVGNEVSTAMCKGIARAGKGTAVYVAEGEKPDSKLMGLLRAARGGVIEDLAIDWGSGMNNKDVMEIDDDFEVVSNPTAPQAAKKIPPLSLFDDQSTGETPELGPDKAIVNLPPPPVIQQAPKSDKLPIPLYPGFRCSIFAIIKQGANPGPYSPQIKITGNVLGRDVALQVPVAPVSVNNTITQYAGGNKLLHTLAAKALIQVFEDMPSTPETKAQIERLGKRYSLSSSVTSFLAIDEETGAE